MARKSSKSTMTKVGEAVKKATKTVAETTEEYVVKPVSKMLGSTGKKTAAKKPAAKKSAGTKSAGSSTASKTAAKKTTTKKTTAKKSTAKKK